MIDTKLDVKTTSWIRQLVSKLSPGQMFSTRDCLNFGPRTAVDQALCRMVKEGDIVRLARGVFTKAKWDTKLPSLSEIAAFKAQAFQRRTVTLPCPAKSGRLPFDFAPKPTPHATDGASSSFVATTQRLVFKRRSPRKLHLAQSTHGLVIRALWELGQSAVTPAVIEKTLLHLGRKERANIKRSCHIMPAWLADILVWRSDEWAMPVPPNPQAA